MFPIPWYAIILITIPQAFLVIDIGSRLFNVQIKWQDILAASLIIGIPEYFYRKYFAFPGLNTIALLLTMIAVLYLISRIKI